MVSGQLLLGGQVWARPENSTDIAILALHLLPHELLVGSYAVWDTMAMKEEFGSRKILVLA
jgi:hypothetical protein